MQLPAYSDHGPCAAAKRGVYGRWHLAIFVLGLALSAGMAARSHATLTLALGIGLALGTPAYRCGGPTCLTAHFSAPPLKADHPMLDDLGIRQTCDLVVNDSDGWWPDGLEPPAGTVSEVPQPSRKRSIDSSADGSTAY